MQCNAIQYDGVYFLLPVITRRRGFYLLFFSLNAGRVNTQVSIFLILSHVFKVRACVCLSCLCVVLCVRVIYVFHANTNAGDTRNGRENRRHRDDDDNKHLNNNLFLINGDTYIKYDSAFF